MQVEMQPQVGQRTVKFSVGYLRPGHKVGMSLAFHRIKGTTATRDGFALSLLSDFPKGFLYSQLVISIYKYLAELTVW